MWADEFNGVVVAPVIVPKIADQAFRVIDRVPVAAERLACLDDLSDSESVIHVKRFAA